MASSIRTTATSTSSNASKLSPSDNLYSRCEKIDVQKRIVDYDCAIKFPIGCKVKRANPKNPPPHSRMNKDKENFGVVQHYWYENGYWKLLVLWDLYCQKICSICSQRSLIKVSNPPKSYQSKSKSSESPEMEMIGYRDEVQFANTLKAGHWALRLRYFKQFVCDGNGTEALIKTLDEIKAEEKKKIAEEKKNIPKFKSSSSTILPIVAKVIISSSVIPAGESTMAPTVVPGPIVNNTIKYPPGFEPVASSVSHSGNSSSSSSSSTKGKEKEKVKEFEPKEFEPSHSIPLVLATSIEKKKTTTEPTQVTTTHHDEIVANQWINSCPAVAYLNQFQDQTQYDPGYSNNNSNDKQIEGFNHYATSNNPLQAVQAGQVSDLVAFLNQSNCGAYINNFLKEGFNSMFDIVDLIHLDFDHELKQLIPLMSDRISFKKSVSKHNNKAIVRN